MPSDEVIEWDVLDGGLLGATIRCPDCPCLSGFGCDGDGALHRPYQLPGGAHLDLHRDGDLYFEVLCRPHGTETPVKGATDVE
jgi:hypothetical protein